MVHLLLNIAFILGNDTGVWPANSTWREDIRWCQNPVAMRCQHDINKGAKELRASAEPPLLLRGGCGLMDWVTTSNIHRSRWPVGHWGLRMHTGESPALIAIVKGHRISHKRIQHSELTSSFLREFSREPYWFEGEMWSCWNTCFPSRGCQFCYLQTQHTYISVYDFSSYQLTVKPISIELGCF